MNVVVLSGGTATNSLTSCFSQISVSENRELTYILPISDNGGSTSEILRVVGGPAIGDIRARVAQLVGDPQVGQLLSYRLPNDSVRAKEEWNSIVEGQHSVWKDIPTPVKEMCRAFIIHMQSELLKKTKSANAFRFEKASVGNFFLTGARLFLGSLDATVELLMRIGRCDPHASVIPCISTNHTHHIAALLSNGEVIRGQSQISHPSKPKASQSVLPPSIMGGTTSRPTTAAKSDGLDLHSEEEQEEEYANPIYILPELKNSQLYFDKLEKEETFSAPIERLLYINPYGEEIKPQGNPRAVSKIKRADMVVYSIGSLVTSLLPIVILGNIADIIAESKSTRKVLLINNSYDRESFWLDGVRYVQLVIESMSRAVQTHRQSKGSKDPTPVLLDWTHFVTDVVYPIGGEIPIAQEKLESMGIKCHGIDSNKMENESLKQILVQIGSSKP